MTTGTVRCFDVSKGYGLIKPDDGGIDVLVDMCAVERAEMASLTQGQRLSFEIVHDERIGRSYAQNLIASEIRTPPLNASNSPITPLHHDRRAIQRVGRNYPIGLSELAVAHPIVSLGPAERTPSQRDPIWRSLDDDVTDGAHVTDRPR